MEQMSELYRKGRPVSGSKGTVLFWVPRWNAFDVACGGRRRGSIKIAWRFGSRRYL